MEQKTTQESPELQKLDFLNFSKVLHKHTLVQGSAILADNLDETIEPKEFETLLYPSKPVKILVTMTLYCLEGCMKIRANLMEYTIKKNDLLSLQPGSIGECLHMSSDFRLILIIFPNNHNFTDLYTKNPQTALQLGSFIQEKAKLSLSQEQMDEFTCLYRIICKQLDDPDFKLKKDLLSGYMQILFCMVSHALQERTQQQEEPPKRQNELFHRFIQLVHEHCQQERNIVFYADKLCITPKYLSQLIHRASGKFASDWIRDFVILEAKALLKNEKFSVQQISDMLHFPNPSFFGKYFKAATGMTPRQYRLQ